MVVKNENLKDFFTKLGVKDTTNIPDKIDFEKIEKDQEINEEDIKKIKEIYEPVIKEQLTKNNFSKVKTSDGKAYVLQLNGEQIKNLSINLLEKTKEIREEINDYLIGEEQELITAREIDNIISAVKEEDSSEIKDFKVTLTQKNRKLNKIECEYGNYILTIDKVKENDKLSYNMSLAINKNQNSTDTNEKSELYWNIQYTGLQDLNKVQKKSQFGLELKMNNDNFKYEYNIDNNLEFKDNVSIDKFDDNSTVILNNYDSQVLTKFLTQVGQRISDVNKKQMEELGLEEDENPIIYSNPITSLVEMFSQGLDDTESLLDTEIEYNYEELSDGTLSIWYFAEDKPHKTIEIPEEIDGKKVSQIGDSLFKENENVEKVVLPKSITTISPEAFCFTTSLRELEINGAVESIGVEGIYGCGELRTLRFPEGLKTLSDLSIASCEKLTDICLPSTVESVNSSNFTLCANPLTIHVPAGSTAENVVRKAIAECEWVAQSEANINIVAE